VHGGGNDVRHLRRVRVKMIRRALLAVVGLVLAASCAPLPILGTPAQRCDVHCAGHMCCDQGDVCGGTEVGCPAGQCCYTGDISDFGARRTHPQHPAP
jgi:hypothetical protein